MNITIDSFREETIGSKKYIVYLIHVTFED